MRIEASMSLPQGIKPDREEQRPGNLAERVSEEKKSDTASAKEGEKSTKTGGEKGLEKASERELIAKLQARDSEVRAHEAAHLAAAGGIASGGASFSYQRGPDGKMYAVGGEVPISTSGGSSPQEKIKIMRQVAAAAMAPADPSPQDYAVAANARSEEMRAMQELRKEQEQMQKELGLKTYEESSKSEESTPL